MEESDNGQIKLQLDINKGVHGMKVLLNGFQLVFVITFKYKHLKLLTVRQAVHEYVTEPHL